MSWGQTADAAGKASESGSTGSMVESSSANSPTSQAFQPISGFSVDAGAGNTPTDGTLVSMTPNQKADAAYYGTSNPTIMDKGAGMLERFQKGGSQGLNESYKNFGNNPETYGAAYGLASRMAGSGKPASAPPITTNISYQQPTNSYLQKRGRY